MLGRRGERAEGDRDGDRRCGGEAGEEDGIGAVGKLDHSQMLTDPEEAATFVKATQLDALAIAIGILLASQIPTNWGIGFAGTLVLLGMTIPLIVNVATLMGVVVACVISVAAVGVPYKLGLVVAIVGGIAAAVVADRVTSSPDTESNVS